MKERDLTRSERYQLMLYRQGKEQSRALPQRSYGDPANSVEFASADKKLKKFQQKK